MTAFPFRQVDVFATGPLTGNPVAVVLDADDVPEARMRDFARWTNLSETTFVLSPTVPGADYRLRIFTPEAELPFAGHPTLGSAEAWLEHTGDIRGSVVQECAAGLVTVRRSDDGLEFAAPPLLRSGRPSDADLAAAAAALRIETAAVLDAAWADNGPGWLAVLLASAEAVLALRPDLAALPFPLGVVGRHGAGGPADFEVRAFVPELGVPEDPVTGSLNAGIALWFAASGRAAGDYTVRQGTAIDRDGLVRIRRDGAMTWVGGACAIRVTGTVDL